MCQRLIMNDYIVRESDGIHIQSNKNSFSDFKCSTAYTLTNICCNIALLAHYLHFLIQIKIGHSMGLLLDT